jgi:HAD superfamily hydrolase (TIGR01549 family)
VIEAVVFDLDGTLLHLPIDYERLIQEFKKVANVDFHPLMEAVAKLDEVARGQVFRVWDLAELAAMEGITVNQEGMKLYSDFAGKPKALVTMQGKALVNVILGKFGLSFDVVVTREDSLNRAKQLEMATEKLATDFQRVLFVGNTDGDAYAAEKVGCQFVRVK